MRAPQITTRSASHRVDAAAHVSETMGSERLRQIDETLIRLAWCAELIRREADAPVYELLPPESKDALVVAIAGGSLAEGDIRSAVTIWSYAPDE
jgi:hypothetical protein